MDNKIVLYHGSQEIISKPMFHKGKKHNDFGYGFYCTKDLELAKEWSVTFLHNGYANKYVLDIEYLNILNLNTTEYTILNWIAILLEHRTFNIDTPIARKARQYLLDNFSINIEAYDVVIGYRADDSYFDYAYAFVHNEITIEQLAIALKLGNLGEQIVLKSEYAFTKISYISCEIVEANDYYTKRMKRESEAKDNYLKLLNQTDDGLYINDIIKGGIKNDNPSIPRIIS